MAVLTFIGESFAKVGFQFYFGGPHKDCPETCTLYQTCQASMQPNMVYEVTEILDKTISCPNDFHDEDMRLVKLKTPLLLASMYNKDIYEGSILKFSPVGCDISDCKFFQYCEPHVLLVQKEDKVKIVQTIKKIKKCPRDLHISVVKLEKRN